MNKFRYEHYLRVSKLGRLIGMSCALYVILYVTFALNNPVVAGLIVLFAILKVADQKKGKEVLEP